jgi:serine/threonine-protein kinase
LYLSSAFGAGTQDDLAQAESALAPHVGPLASILVARASRHSVSIGDLVAALAREVTDDTRRQAFLASAPR